MSTITEHLIRYDGPSREHGGRTLNARNFEVGRPKGLNAWPSSSTTPRSPPVPPPSSLKSWAVCHADANNEDDRRATSAMLRLGVFSSLVHTSANEVAQSEERGLERVDPPGCAGHHRWPAKHEQRSASPPRYSSRYAPRNLRHNVAYMVPSVSHGTIHESLTCDP